MWHLPRGCVQLIMVTLAAVSLAGCGAGGAVSQPSSSSAASIGQASPSPAWGDFTSDRHAYSIGLPSDWRVVEHTGSTQMAGMRVGSAGTDTIGSRDTIQFGGDDGLVVVSTHELDGAESLADFTARFSRTAACKSAGLPIDDTELDGEAAEKRYFKCGEWMWDQITAIHGNRGYVLWFVATMEPPPDARPINDQLLATFRFTD